MNINYNVDFLWKIRSLTFSTEYVSNLEKVMLCLLKWKFKAWKKCKVPELTTFFSTLF